jgi:uncharacterized protein YjiS (DUF1127 family)
MRAVSLYRAVRDWGRTHSLRRELERLSDRQLADIGLRREQIELVSAHGGMAASRMPL